MKVHGSTSPNSQKVETTQISISWWMQKQVYIVYPYNGMFFSCKRNEVLTHAATWMNLKNLPSERSQTWKSVTYCYRPFWIGPKQGSSCTVSFGPTEWDQDKVPLVQKQRKALFFKIILFMYLHFWLCWVFIALLRLSLVVVNRDYSPLQCTGFSLWWLLVLEHRL